MNEHGIHDIFVKLGKSQRLSHVDVISKTWLKWGRQLDYEKVKHGL